MRYIYLKIAQKYAFPSLLLDNLIIYYLENLSILDFLLDVYKSELRFLSIVLTLQN